MIGYPEGTIYIEIRGVYDGWSVAKLPSGEMVNRWTDAYPMYAPTQKWIDARKEQPE